MMKKLLLATVAIAAVAAAGSAGAADLPVYKAPPVVAPPIWSWTGCYIGGHAGSHRSSYDQHLSFDDVPGGRGGGGGGTNVIEFNFTDSLSPKGGIYGGQVGCNIQFGTYVWGIEGDYSGASGTDSRFYTPDPSTDSVAFSARTRSLWSVRSRFGVAADRAFIYGTAGWAGARFNYTFDLNDADSRRSTGDFTYNTNGVVVGVGVEYVLWNNIVVGSEYLHYAFGNDQTLPSVPTVGPWGAGGDHINLKTVDVIRVRASYLFSWGGGPVVARY